MKFGYYNLEKDDFGKDFCRYKKKKLFTITFNHLLEMVQFENSDRGYLLWVVTKKRINAFGYWNPQYEKDDRSFYQHWANVHIGCG